MNNKNLPQCTYVNSNGKRCRKHSAIKHRVFLDSELYNNYAYANCVETNLCVEHFLAFGGEFNNKSKIKKAAEFTPDDPTTKKIIKNR